MSWTPRIEDGTTTENGEWFSLQIRPNIPREITYGGNRIAYISYITKVEWDLLYASAVKFAKLQLTPWNVYFVSKETTFRSASNYLVSPPLYWRSSPEHALARLIYLTQDQINMLKSIDIHGSGIATKNNYGPLNIPSYQGNSAISPINVGEDYYDDAGDNQPYVYFEEDRYDDAGDNVQSIVQDSKPIESVITPIKSEQQIESRIYKGSLSSLGSMVAQGLNTADPDIIITTAERGFETGQRLSFAEFNNQSMELGDRLRGKAAPVTKGYIRQYWEDPRQITFGSDSEIPALTGVIPNPFTLKDGTRVIGFTGSFIYYVDLQLKRFTGGDQWNINHFISVFRLVQTSLTVNNQFLASAKNGEKPIENHGGSTMTEVNTRKFNRFKKGTSILSLFRNSGKLVENLTKGEFRDNEWIGFGSANAVIKSLVDNNFADIIINNQTLADTIEFAGIDYQDIWNPEYTTRFAQILKLITDKTTLKTIQETLKTNVVNIESAFDFTIYEKVAGIKSDDNFKTISTVGKEFGIHHSSITATTGEEIATMIESVVVPNISIESISGNGQTVNKRLTKEIRARLVKGEDNGPATMQDVAGVVSGNLLDQMKKINSGIAKIYETGPGQDIKNILQDISLINAKMVVEKARVLEESKKQRSPKSPPIVSNLPALEQELDRKKSLYKISVALAANNVALKSIVKEVNDNYLECCRALYREVSNWHLFNFSEIEPVDQTGQLSFIRDLNSFGEDADNIGTDDLFKGLLQDTEPGHRFAAALGLGKTDAAISKQGGRKPTQL